MSPLLRKLCFHRCWLVVWLVCLQDYTKTTIWISTKVGCGMAQNRPLCFLGGWYLVGSTRGDCWTLAEEYALLSATHVSIMGWSARYSFSLICCLLFKKNQMLVKNGHQSKVIYIPCLTVHLALYIQESKTQEEERGPPGE